MCDAKPIVRKTLLEAGHALAYFEPESTVIGRSGDECVVALTDQWYLSYGDEQWRSLISTHIHSEAFNSYNAPLLESFDKAIAWLQEWACSREFGLGTQLPWDTKWVIDSLSDSTVYMALYTIAHRFFGGEADNLAGTNGCPCGISPEALTDEIYDYIFLRKPLPAGFSTTIETKLLDELRTEVCNIFSILFVFMRILFCWQTVCCVWRISRPQAFCTIHSFSPFFLFFFAIFYSSSTGTRWTCVCLRRT